MREITRRAVIGSTVGAASLFAGCSEDSSSGSFTRTAVEEQQLIVEFEESLEAETISVVDPDGEAFAETSVSAGASRVTFDIEIPYTPGEYRIVATDGDETVTETTQEIRPELEIVDVGVGANRMDEMPEDLHFPERQVIIGVENSGTGPEGITRLEFSEEFPNSNANIEGSGIFDEESGTRGATQETVPVNKVETLFSSSLPFAEYETECGTESTATNASIRLQLGTSGEWLDQTVEILYLDGSSDGACDVELKGGQDA